MPTPKKRERRYRPAGKSKAPHNWCEYCGSYVDVYYDRDVRRHTCSACWVHSQPPARMANHEADPESDGQDPSLP